MGTEESADAIVPGRDVPGRAKLFGAGDRPDDSVDVESREGMTDQLSLFGEEAVVRHLGGGEAGSRSAPTGERQASWASEGNRALVTDTLMERICEPKNLNWAYRRVKANRGSPGVDGMTVGELRAWLAAHKEEFIAQLLDGSYRPREVRGVEIPKPGGGVRQLGIPTVVDRLVQQAILQVLTRCWTRPFRSRATASGPDAAPTRRC